MYLGTAHNVSARDVARVAAGSVIVLLGILLAGGLQAWAADGDLDLSFGSGGKVVTDFNANNDWLSKISVQPDGKIVAVGDVHPGGKFALARYNPDGTLDATFGNGGKVITTTLRR